MPGYVVLLARGCVFGIGVLNVEWVCRVVCDVHQKVVGAPHTRTKRGRSWRLKVNSG